ncbi:hypothetical protein QN363_19590, partial [Undibacterium sp. CCC2.1]|uniref:hypothetical protein n=1 Tax=Undibacterium sp. CCC2.1 TaxID=3048604 RepID=UPI002B2385FC
MPLGCRLRGNDGVGQRCGPTVWVNGSHAAEPALLREQCNSIPPAAHLVIAAQAATQWRVS